MKNISRLFFAIALLAIAKFSFADDYVMDVKGMHTFVQFKVKHLGYSWLYGQFTDFDGKFTYDAKDDAKNSVSMQVNVNSLDSKHAERDKHLRGKKYLNTKANAEATFVSTSYKTVSENKAVLVGKLNLLGVTKEVSFDVDIIGGGRDPWGGYRQGFEATTTLKTADFGMGSSKYFPEVQLIVSVEGCKAPNAKCSK